MNISELRSIVLTWYSTHGRVFPWRDTKNPFHVFVAEILLRQTQADRVIGPYSELIARYPDVETLASAIVEELKIWFKPLGLVNRAENLVRAANVIIEKHEGKIPGELNALLGLPGIGIYSARAIACLAFNERVPMIDESSGRLLRRCLGIRPQGPAYCDRRLLNRANKIIPMQNCREFNLGLLDIAAKYCRPTKPLCAVCPLRALCSRAHKTNLIKN